ncbi:MAG: hypothetical protein RSC73_02775 [Ruthenibacterium sp.]
MKSILHCAEKTIDLNQCEILYDRPFSKSSLEEDFEAASGTWHVDETGWLVGLETKNAGGILYSNKNYQSDIILEFDAQTVPPCKNDINFVLSTIGWDYEKNDAGKGYIGGIGGWWNDNAGFEKYPACLPRALTPLFSVTAGQCYHITAGVLCGACFLFVDGQRILEMTDPAPLDFAGFGRFGLGTYASHVRFHALTVYKAAGEKIVRSYPSPL